MITVLLKFEFPKKLPWPSLTAKSTSSWPLDRIFFAYWLFEFMLQFNGSGCITVGGAWFLSILFSYMLDYYFTTLILRRFEVWHSGNVMIECISEEAIYYYVAGNFFPTACTVIGYFEVTWHIYLTMKLFPAKISEKATLQNIWCQRVTTVHCLNVSLSFALGNIEILGRQN